MRIWGTHDAPIDPIAAILADHEIRDEKRIWAIHGLRGLIVNGLNPMAAMALLSAILDPEITSPLAEFGRIMVSFGAVDA